MNISIRSWESGPVFSRVAFEIDTVEHRHDRTALAIAELQVNTFSLRQQFFKIMDVRNLRLFRGEKSL